jgi:hypothetical protein
MVREEDPFHFLNSDFGQVIKQTSIPEVYEQTGPSLPEQIHIAGIAPDEEVREQLFIWLRPSSC